MISPSSTYLECLFKSDPQIAFLPSFLLDRFLEYAVFKSTDIFKQHCESFDTLWIERYNRNHKFYNRLEKKIEKYFETMNIPLKL